MSELRRLLVITALVLMPTLAWTFSGWRQKAARQRVLATQMEEGKASYARYMQLSRIRHGIVVGQPVRLPFSYQAVGTPPPVGQGQWAFIWVGSVAEQCWDEQSVEGWRELLERCPQMVLVAILPNLNTHEAQRLASSASLQRLYLLTTSDEAIWERMGSVGTFLLVDGRGVVREQGVLRRTCGPTPEEREKIPQLMQQGGA